MAGPEITITKAEGAWVVRALGAIIGESKNVLMLKEGDYPEVAYIPREDITMAFLDASDTITVCPHKGDASYFHLVGKNRTIKDIAWSYESPIKPVTAIKGHLAFYQEHATVESVS
ncbi:MAG: DUF427 domain-containing protein [Rhodobacteraceae bacterium]|nr:DUF427 domain-containing protein [Paracoccaceae bacterium]